MEITPNEKRRYQQREFSFSQLRGMFNIDDNEMIIDVYYDKTINYLVVKTILDYDKTKGDL